MKMVGLFGSLLALAIPLSVFAGWEVVNSKTTLPREPFFQTPVKVSAKRTSSSVPVVMPSGTVPQTYAGVAFANQFANLGQPAPIYAVSISGSLKENLERIMSLYHWRVIWKAPYDYNFDGKITGSSLQNVVEKLLKPFPVQAVMYMSNRTLAVVPRYGNN